MMYKMSLPTQLNSKAFKSWKEDGFLKVSNTQPIKNEQDANYNKQKQVHHFSNLFENTFNLKPKKNIDFFGDNQTKIFHLIKMKVR